MSYFLIGIGVLCFALALGAHAKVEKLERTLKAKGVLEEGWDRDN